MYVFLSDNYRHSSVRPTHMTAVRVRVLVFDSSGLKLVSVFAHHIATATVGISVGALYQKLYIQSKSAPEDGRICSPKYVGLI